MFKILGQPCRSEFFPQRYHGLSAMKSPIVGPQTLGPVKIEQKGPGCRLPEPCRPEALLLPHVSNRLESAHSQRWRFPIIDAC